MIFFTEWKVNYIRMSLFNSGNNILCCEGLRIATQCLSQMYTQRSVESYQKNLLIR